ncbi:MAG: ArsR/SmtB family transcription factor [Chloroflexota bacterium]
MSLDDVVFKALADPARRRLLDRLRTENGQPLTKLCAHMNMTRQAVTKHLALLEAANFVVTVRHGREKLHYLNPVPIADLSDRWIATYERHRLRALNDLKRNLNEAQMEKPSYVYVTYIATTPERLWEALTTGEFTRQYWGGRRLTSTWQVGAPVSHVREDGGVDWNGEVLRWEPLRRLAYTFHMQISDAHRGERPSRVTFELEPLGPVVKLTLTHDEFGPESATLETTRHGWPAILSSLKSLLERGAPLGFSTLGFGPSRAEERRR